MGNNKTKSTILINGAGGFLGSELIKQFLEKDNFNIIAYTSQKDKLADKYNNTGDLICYNYEDWKNGEIPFHKVDVLINAAFARISDGKELASSLAFTDEFISHSASEGAGAIINISSQSVYSQKRKSPAREDTAVNPESLYGITKYATEILISNICNHNNIFYTNLRLGSLVGRTLDARLTNRFIKSAIDGETIKINGGQQIISYLDVRDAAEGIIKLASVKSNKWKTVYNFGIEESHALYEIAEMVKKIAPEFIPNLVNIKINEGNDFINLSLDCSQFYEDTSWEPKYDMESIIRYIFEDSLGN